MESREAYAIENRDPAIQSIQSDAAGLVYFIDGTRRIAIAGERGVTLLSKRQALALLNELEGIVKLYL